MNAKQITIPYQGKMTLTELKAAFSEHFPFLKWEFFYHPHKNNGGSSKKDMITSNPRIEQINPQLQAGQLLFTEETSVSELEQMIWNQCQISVQVFRKSGTIWLETTVTDQWSLGFQNEQGRELSEQFDRKK